MSQFSGWSSKNSLNNNNTGMRSYLLDLFIEVAIYVASELLVKQLNLRSQGLQGRRIKILLAQSFFLAISVLLLYLLHHVAYILILATLVLIAHTLWAKRGLDQRRVKSPPLGTVVSKPIVFPQRKSVTSKNASFQDTPWNLESSRNDGQVVSRYRTKTNVTESATPQKFSNTCSAISNAEFVKRTGYGGNGLERKEILSQRIQRDKRQVLSNSCASTHLPSYGNELWLQDNVHRSEEKAEFLGSFPEVKRMPLGLPNTGNVCFVNSILQCLAWTPGFHQLLSNVTLLNGTVETVLCENLDNVFNATQSFSDSHASVGTEDLLACMSDLAPHLVSSASSAQKQQDAAEFLLWLLNHLHGILQASNQLPPFTEKDVQDKQELKRVSEESIKTIGSSDLKRLELPMTDLSKADWELHWQTHSSDLHDMFLGQLLEARECQNCKNVTMSIEYFTLLPLPIPEMNEANVTKCFESFCKPEELLKDNMIICSCLPGNFNPASRLALLSVVPKCLVIQLTRFSFDSTHKVAIKQATPVCILQEMDLFPYTMTYKLNPSLKNSMQYSLYAVCVHSGAEMMTCGHYIAYCKASDGQWYLFNDDIVYHVDNIDAELNSRFVLCNAYLLLYHRRE